MTKVLMPDGEFRDIKIPQFKTPYNHDTNDESDRTALYCKDPSLTKQEFKEDADINNIINRFLKTGEPPPMALPEHFMDVSSQPSYHEMMTKTAEANAAFYVLPAEKRAEFQNDPTRWADAVVVAHQQGDVDALENLGIDVADARAELNKKATEAFRKAQEASKSTPDGGGTPAPTSPTAPSGPSKTDGKKPSNE